MTRTLLPFVMATALRFTVPAFDAQVDSTGVVLCEASIAPLDELLEAQLWAWSESIWPPQAIDSLGGCVPGQIETFFVQPAEGEQTTYYVRTRKPGGPWSCPSNLVTLNGRVSVEPARTEAWLGVPRPNPTRGLVVIPYGLPEARRGSLEVFDVHGRRVLGAELGAAAAGVHVADLRRLPPGIYVVALQSGAWSATRRLLVLR